MEAPGHVLSVPSPKSGTDGYYFNQSDYDIYHDRIFVFSVA